MPPQSSPAHAIPAFPIAHALIILAVFLLYGSSVRKGIVRGSAILWAGVFAGAIAVGIYAFDMLPLYRAGAPIWMAALPPLMMAGLAAFCVAMSYHQQRVRDIATFTAGDTKVIVRVCPPIAIPDADALLLPVSTALRGNDAITRMALSAAGPQVTDALAKQGPVGMGKVISTVGGALSVGHIFHAAIADAGRPTDGARLKRGIENAAQQARKAGAESLAVPLGQLTGLAMQDSLAIPIDAVLRQRKAFAEVVFVVFEPRTASLVKTILTTALSEDEKKAVAASSS